jgi:hypothetical protein
MIFGYVYMKDEPGAHADALAPALRRLTEAIGIPPRKMTETAAKPKHRGQRKFSWEWFGEAARSAEAVSLWGGPARIAPHLHGSRDSPEELSARFNLRYFRDIEMRFQQPALIYIVVPRTDDASERRFRIGAVETFLLEASQPCHPLHGGIAATVDSERAFEELHMSTPGPPLLGDDGKPMEDRLDFDQRRSWQLFAKARRAYWLTILGHDLAAAAGGIQGARSSEAVRVEMKGDCLIVQTTDEIVDSLAADWPARTAKLRRWIWPHTIQNPADAPEAVAHTNATVSRIDENR